MDAAERAALVRGAGWATARVTRTVADTHVAILDAAHRSVRSLGPAGQLPVTAATAMARANYAAVAGAARVVGALGAPAAAASAPLDAVPASDRPAAVPWLAALSGAFGDRMVAEPELRALTVPMALRDRGTPVDLRDPGSVPDPRDTLVLFVHGLANHESMWSEQYLAVVQECGATPLTVRYTTGQPIADSGAELAALLDDVAGTWPVAPRRIVLVGHSMGGLVIRAALAREGRWRALVTDAVTLGTPHSGAPLERVARRALAVAAGFPVTAPFAALGDERSVGIKDLAHGDVAEPHPEVQWHVVAAHLGGPAVSGRLGDGLVWADSAFAVPRESTAQQLLIGDAGHLALLDHPEVAALVRGVLERS